MSNSKTIQETFIALISIWAVKFQSDPELMVKTICNTDVPINVCCDIYKLLTSDKAMKKMEELNEDERKLFYNFKPIIDEAKNENKLSCYQAIHTIDFLSKNI